MKRCLIPLLLCALLLCGCGGGEVHVYHDEDTVWRNQEVMGFKWLSTGAAAVLRDAAVPKDAVFTLATTLAVQGDSGSTESFWEGLGFQYLPPDSPRYNIARVAGTKALWNSLFTAEEMETVRTQIYRSWLDNGGYLYIYRPAAKEVSPEGEWFVVERGSKASPGVRLYAAHPERFVNPPTVAYRINNRTYYAGAQTIPKLLEQEDVHWIQFVGHYMVKE